MKKQYEQPMAEKIDFNYKETIVASNTPSNIKDGTNDVKCYRGKSASEGCRVKP